MGNPARVLDNEIAIGCTGGERAASTTASHTRS